MPMHLTEKNGGKVLEIEASGKLTHKDYTYVVPEFVRLVKRHQKIRLLFDMVDFHGWDAGGAWDDLKFGLKLVSHLERIALVGDRKWEKTLSNCWRPFTGAKLRYFDRANSAEARTWLEEN